MFSALADILRQQWATRVNERVAARFNAFAARLLVTPLQVTDAQTKVAGVVRCLNRHYWGSHSPDDHAIVEGSWGKGTQSRPPRDVDLMFVLPFGTYQRFEQRAGNRQSALLQEVKDVLRISYPRTDLRQDGQVVTVGFEQGHGVEVLPAILLESGKYWICDTNDGGRYKVVDPSAEIAAVADSDTASMATTRELVRMLKRWQRHCNVDLPSFVIELIAIDFLQTVTYGLHARVLYDWLIRDFFRYLITRANTFVFVPGTFRPVFVGEGWLTRAQTAAGRAERASQHEERENPDAALAEWQNIFGFDIS
jgi:hypothetical protein